MSQSDAQPNTRSPLQTYKEKYEKVRGFFMEEAIAMWDFLLTAQRENGIAGNFFEIGVLEGKSALLGAVHLRPDEVCILVDYNDVSSVAERTEGLGITTVCCTGLRSDNPGVARKLRDYEGTVRWFHIDGAHDGSQPLATCA